ncbi:oxygenase MpaB family protein [Microbacterium sp. ARD31]|uniref:oxygenase MpaB family protein n=1 Tax=Microbacterium sp. ARD31 TaxID=2962576 RepID=UPI0028813F28|nr:oxygenase MpaB family protein [Microbacterium sp. ARD31]MDT0180616.1 oxygenase MpaB family protein [Microbacterium sp. ARD31]
MDLTPLRQRLLTALAGDPEGAPPWVLRLSEGDDAGYFPENGAAWTVHAGTATLIAGIRALLVQALHPGALAGVHDFSRYREDPLGRLAGTVRWVICVTYGSTEQADAETARVGRFHQQVKGTYQSTEGRAVAYSAADAELVEWVHLAFADAFLTSHRTYGGPIPGGPDAYVAEWATAGRLMRVKEPPRTADELARALESYRVRGILQGGPRVDDVVRFLRRPPVGGGMALGYRLFFAAAVATIPKELRRLLGVRRSVLPVVTLTRAVLPIVTRVLESGGPRAHDRAHERIRRVRSNASG